jgi:endonuclease/exonuclease/phosphatase family metal-dependent hydrolase
MHPPCCNAGPEDGESSSNAQRQQVVDGVVAFLRDLKEGDGAFEVAPDTPIVVLGDMNFVGDAQQPRTLRTGQIVNTDRFGAPATPDWDGSPLLDTKPRQVASPMHTTWIDAKSSFPPGRLDYAYVSDHVLEPVHEFVLYTPALPEETRTTHNLRVEDTNVASDHLPVVIDVAAR